MEIHTTDRLLDKTDADLKEPDLQMYEEIRAQLTDRCRAQGWFYTILLTGLIAL